MMSRRALQLPAGILLTLLGAVAIWFFLRFRAIDPGELAPLVEDSVRISLVGEAGRAQVLRESAVIRFGQPESRRHYHEPDPRLRQRSSGFKSLLNSAGQACAVAVGESASVDFFCFDQTERRATLEAAGLDDGQGAQQVAVWLNESKEPIARLALLAHDRTERHSFNLPGELLRVGQNRLRFSFERSMRWIFTPEQLWYPYSAVFTTLEVQESAAGGSGFDVGKVRAPAEETARPGLIIEQGTRVTFAIRIPSGDSRLLTSLFVHPEDRAQRTIPFSVRLCCDGQETILLSKNELDAGTEPSRQPAIRLEKPLSLFKGEVASLEFEAPPAPPGKRPLRVVVADPLVLGNEVPGSVAPPAARPLVEQLRERLRGRNLAIIVLDAASARHFTAYGAEEEHAPNVDLLAREGIVFEATTSPASFTLAGVASMITGQFPDTHKVVAIGSEKGTLRLSGETKTLAEAFAGAGYHTLALVTNPNAGSQFGFDRGFALFDALYDPARGFWNEGVAGSVLPERLRQHLDAGALEEPFLLSVHVFQPHAPYAAPLEFRQGVVDPAYNGPADGSRESIDAYKFHTGPELTEEDFRSFENLYHANLRYADQSTRDILALLQERGLLERTAIVVVSDHGESFGEHSSLEHGDTVYGEQVDVPWFMLLPPDIGLGPTRVPGPCSLIDLAPTLASMFSLVGGSAAFEGLDLTPRLLGAAPAERPLILRSSGLLPRFGIRALHHAYHLDTGTRQPLLFDLSNDPLETLPCQDETPILAEYLRAELCRFLCERAGRSAEHAEMTEEMLKQMREIGYLEIGVATEGGCPLLRRRFGE
ncbi:MAG: sulfatase [Planctomycetota bacterium]